jgi:hypothetical protein
MLFREIIDVDRFDYHQTHKLHCVGRMQSSVKLQLALPLVAGALETLMPALMHLNYAARRNPCQSVGCVYVLEIYS